MNWATSFPQRRKSNHYDYFQKRNSDVQIDSPEKFKNYVMNPPKVEDLQSVGRRLRWPSIIAGGVLAFAIFFLLMIIGNAIGLSI